MWCGRYNTSLRLGQTDLCLDLILLKPDARRGNNTRCNMRISFAFISAIVLLAFSPACSRDASAQKPSSEASTKTGLPDRDPALAHRLVAEGGVLLDVRTPEEYAEHHVDGAVNIPVGDLESRLAEIEKLTSNDKSKSIVVYCRSGGRASRAKTMLLSAGYEKVTNLGGIDNWEQK